MTLAEQTCKPMEPGTAPLSREEVRALQPQVAAWSLADGELRREFRFRDFHAAMDFVNDVAAMAAEQDHHPDFFISYKTVTLTLSTHKIGGLSLNDFIVAAKIDLLAARRQTEKAA